MRDTVKIDWRVPSDEWELFREYVREKFGSLDGYLGREAERAMEEYADADGGERVEELVDRLVQAAGRRSEDPFGENKFDLDTSTKSRVSARVDAEVKESFRTAAAEADDPFGVTFARAIQEYRDGGRYGRLERRLERIVDDAESFLSHVAESGKDTSELSLRERNTIAIAERVGGDTNEFADGELESAIVEVASVSSDKSINEYRDRVTDRLDVEPHPNVGHLWIPSEKAAECAPGVPKACRQPVDQLDHDERARRIQLAVGRRAATQSSGRIRVDTADIREDILDGDVTKSTTLNLTRTAARTRGIDVDTSTSPATLRVNLETLGECDSELFKTIITYRDEAEGGLLSSTTRTNVSDWSGGEQTDDGTPASVDEEFDRILGGSTDRAIADGGETLPGGGGS